MDKVYFKRHDEGIFAPDLAAQISRAQGVEYKSAFSLLPLGLAARLDLSVPNEMVADILGKAEHNLGQMVKTAVDAALVFYHPGAIDDAVLLTDRLVQGEYPCQWLDKPENAVYFMEEDQARTHYQNMKMLADASGHVYGDGVMVTTDGYRGEGFHAKGFLEPISSLSNIGTITKHFISEAILKTTRDSGLVIYRADAEEITKHLAEIVATKRFKCEWIK